ncbi:PBP1A family penicillin-binding protein [Candidatus Saccharibacteria bacterium]|nr:PBP1A family penicillin-binding protein [Candidatus Saccharibacteria bacterium]
MRRQGKYTKRLNPLQKGKRFWRRHWNSFKRLSRPKKFLLVGGPIIAFLVITPLATYAYFARDIGNQERLMNRNNTGIVLTDKNNEAFYSTGRAQHRATLGLDKIADDTERALIASEDKNFYDHPGFSIGSMIGALYANFTTGKTEYGGSTLTQQLAKNTLLSNDRNFLRKFQELSIAIAIERTYTKDQILDMYLNSVYYGEGAFGIDDAARTYFNKSPADLTLGESAMLIGVLPSPANYSPINGDKELARERQTVTLTRMVDNKSITEAQKTAALAETLTYAEVKNVDTDNVAPHFTEMVLNDLYKKYGEERVTRSGYQVQTTLDLGLQKKLNENINSRLSYIQNNGGTNASGVAIDPTTGQVRALAGSADWNNSTFGKVNMATTPRQPGSSFKPIYYAEALARGIITPATILADVPTDFGGYKPLNANKRFSGNVTVRNALARSLNIPAVKVMEKLGVSNAIKSAKQAGISTLDSTDYGLSLALGTAEVPLIEMTNAYAAYANQGSQFDTTNIRRINDKFNDTIFEQKSQSEQVISKEGAYLISSILSDKNARAPIFGNSLTVSGRTVAVKTGTTENARDAWTIGYTPQIAIGIWVGNNDNSQMQSGGSDMAGPIWVKTMTSALTGSDNLDFPVPSGIVKRSVCVSNGALASTSTSGTGVYSEYFMASALPTERCVVDTREDDEKARKEAEDKLKQAEDDAKKAEEDSSGTPPSGGGTDNSGPPPVDGTTDPTSPPIPPDPTTPPPESPPATP